MIGLKIEHNIFFYINGLHYCIFSYINKKGGGFIHHFFTEVMSRSHPMHRDLIRGGALISGAVER